MARSKDKFKDKAKTPIMVIDGVKGIVEDNTEWHFYSWKRRFFDYLLDLIKDPNLQNPLDKWDWDFLPEPSDDYDQNSCAESLLKSSEREKGVLINYKNLLRRSQKDATTQDNLENQFRINSLEQAKSKDPWKLITKPTLNPSHIAPSKKGFLAFGMLAGFLMGRNNSAIQDKKSRKIFALRSKKTLNKYTFLDYINIKENSNTKISLGIISSSNALPNNEKVYLLSVGEIPLVVQNLVLDELNRNKTINVLEKVVNLTDALKQNNIIIITQLGITKKDELETTTRLISRENKQPLGMLILDDEK